MGKKNIVPFRKLREMRYHFLKRRKLRKEIVLCQKSGNPLNLNIGASIIHYKKWISLDLPFFDLRKINDFEFYFTEKSIDKILMEHVLEHLSDEHVILALTNIKRFIKPKSGKVRIAVPDKNHPDPNYIEYVRPNGSGPGADDHKSFWNIESISKLAIQLGYQLDGLEYYDDKGIIHTKAISDSEGPIRRTIQNPQNRQMPIYSSLIVDLKIS